MITEMKRYCDDSPGWKFIDHDKMNMVYEWIDELLARIGEGEIINLCVLSIETDAYIWQGMLKINGGVQPIAEYKNAMGPDFFQKKVISATYTISRQLFSQESMVWRINLYV